MILTLYRPAKTKDSTGGGWTIGVGEERRLHGELKFHDNRIFIVVRVREDVAVEDIIGINAVLGATP